MNVPEPGELQAMRQEFLARRFGLWLAVPLAVVGFFVNFCVGSVGAVRLGISGPTFPFVVLAFALLPYHYSASQARLRGRPSAALTTESSPDATLHQLGRKRLIESTEGVT